MPNKNTFIVLLSFEQGDIATLNTSTADALRKAAALGEANKGFDIRDLWLTTGDYHVVVILRAPVGADAQRIKVMFEQGLDLDVKDVIELTKADADAADIVDAFNGHTKM